MGWNWMKNLHLLVWLTQLGLSTAVPLVGFIWLAVWLRNRFDLGSWVIFVGIALGIYSAVDGLRNSLRTMEKLSRKEEEENKPPRSFNNHE